MSEIFKASVKENRLLTDNHYLLTLHPLQNIRKPQPGQFFMLSVDESLDPLLKRPFSLHRWIDGDLQILYRVVGKATKLLKGKRPGEYLEVLGPLGNGFPQKIKTGARIIFAAGGMGVAPILALADSFHDRRPLLFYGARTAKELLCLDDFKALGIEPAVSTDDGSSGKKGTIINDLNDFLKSDPSDNNIIYSCGPKPMLAALSKLAAEYKITAYMALEENMACGIGTCLGCVVNTRSGHKRVCKDGPVFSSEEIIW